MSARFNMNTKIMRNFSFRTLAVPFMALALLTGCGTTKVMETWTSDEVTPVEPRRLAVLAAWPEDLQRRVIERDIVSGLRDDGINAVAASELPGMSSRLTRSEAEKALRNANVDAVVLIFVVGGGGGGRYVRSDYWMEYAGTGVGYGWYHPYYADFYDVYVVREGPGYTESTTEIFLETSYVDVRQLSRVWSIVTKSDDIEYQDLAGKLAGKVSSQMKKHDQL